MFKMALRKKYNSFCEFLTDIFWLIHSFNSRSHKEIAGHLCCDHRSSMHSSVLLSSDGLMLPKKPIHLQTLYAHPETARESQAQLQWQKEWTGTNLILHRCLHNVGPVSRWPTTKSWRTQNTTELRADEKRLPTERGYLLSLPLIS